MANTESVRRDLEAFERLLGLWQAENPVKTWKLQTLLAVNAGLVAAFQLGGGVRAGNALLCLAAAVLCVVWLVSLARTVLFQLRWREGLRAIAGRYPDDPRFQILEPGGAPAPKWLRVLGGVSSRYYLVGAPLAFAVFWLTAALLALA